MIRRILIPPVNEHKFVTYNDIITGTRYNQHQFDRAWMSEQIRDWQDYRDYGQKRQFNDRCSIQISALPDSTVELKLYKCDHSVVLTETIDPLEQANSDTFIWYHDDVAYNCFPFFDALFWQNPALEEGRYYFVIDITNGSDVDQIISEPIDLAEYQVGTVLDEWTNRFNKDLCIFEQTRQKFSVRVEGDVLDFKPMVERVSFVDHEYNTTELSATSFRAWTLVVGNTPSGIPDYLLDILNYGWGLTNKRREGKAYVAADGAAWTKSDWQGSVLGDATLEVREQNIDDAYKITKGSFTVIASTEYPWVNMFITIGKDGFDEFYYPIRTYVDDDTSRDNLVDDLNDALTDQGLDGEFQEVAGNIDYVLGANEDFDEFDAPMLTKYIIINSVTTGSSQNLNLALGLTPALTGGSSAYALINPSGVLQQADYISGTSTYPVSSAYVTGATGTYTHYLFHDNTLDKLVLSGDYINNFTNSKFPEMLRYFTLQDSPRITALPVFNVMMHCALSLKRLIINNNITLNAISNYSDYTIGTIYGNSMRELDFISLAGNNMNTVNLNGWYNSMKDAMQQLPSQFIIFNGLIDTTAQIGGAQPSNFPNPSNSSLARSLLINTYNWDVII